jgi:MipA family protein
MKKLLVGLAFILPAWSAAHAQDSRDIRVRVGAGAQLRPMYVGSDDTNVSPVFHVNIARGANQFAFSAPDDSPGIALTASHGLSFGVAGNLDDRRNSSDVGAAVHDLKRTFEAGAFVQYEWHDSFRIRGELLKGIGGHEGVLGTISADKIWREGDRYVISVGPRVLFADGRYQRAYFGVSPEDSVTSGLAKYRPSSGIYAVAAAAGVTYALNDRWGLFGFGRYERLVGDAAKSPIVREFGSRNQLFGGGGVNYTFTIHRGPKAQ